MMAAAIWGFQQAFTRDLDMGPTDILMIHADASGLALTGNSETIYGVAMIDTKPGPVVLDVPPRVLGFLNDQWMRPMGDLGIVGPDHGQGGRYLLVPPGYEGDLPTDGFVATMRLRTYRQWLVLRAFMGPGGDPAPAIETLRGTQDRTAVRLATRRRPATSTAPACPTTPSTRPTSATSRTSRRWWTTSPPTRSASRRPRSWCRSASRRESRSRPTRGCEPSSTRRPRSAATWRSRSRTPRATTTSDGPTASGST